MDIFTSLISGLIGVLVGCFLNKVYEVRKEKLSVLKALITYRWMPAQPERVKAINIIPVIFSKSTKICARLESYKKAQNDVADCLSTSPGLLPQKYNDVEDAYIKLLEEIAKSLGYGKSLTWDKLKSPYIARYYLDQNGNQIWY